MTIKEPISPTKAANSIKSGNIKEVAKIRLTTKNLKAFTPETSIASICSVTRIDPSSAPMLEPTLPAQIRAVTNGASDFITAIPTREGNHEVAPNSESDGLDCLVKTKPVMRPVTAISGNDLTPTS